ncbi:MAG: hypothetical protein AB8I08_15035 [Sandaracinaceae bacterium]
MHAKPSSVGATRTLTALMALSLLAGCGARTALENEPPEAQPRPVPSPEVCNGLDDDLDGLRSVGAIGEAGMDAALPEAGLVDAGPPDAGRDGGSMDAAVDGGSSDGGVEDVDLFIDEDFRDGQGRYVDRAHCGGCNQPCLVTGRALDVDCALVEETPTCVATRCEAGFVPSTTGRCVPAYERLCMTCADDGDCGDFDAARCDFVAGERRCTVGCAVGCPEGYRCDAAADACIPNGGSCSCEPGDVFSLACALIDPDGERCPGLAFCADGELSECQAPEEVCDEADNDCDGIVDEGFRNGRGAYILDIQHCGMCGVDCTTSTVPEGDLVCGGDPFAPQCVLACPDAADGIDPGDRIDADRIIATGCECTVGSLTDEPGPVRTSGEDLDVNCDGADGIVLESFYVATDGNDDGPGSPTRPLRTLNVALARAAESLSEAEPRPHVFVASGTYAESVTVPDGVLVHGGYRRDFLALDPDGFTTQVRAPVGTEAPGGAAVVISPGAGTRPTLLEWMTLLGLDAESAGDATFGVVAVDPGPELTLRDLTVAAGVPGDGVVGVEGVAGRDFETLPEVGAPPRAAIENAGSRECLREPRNVVAGGTGGRNSCGGTDVSGGEGGSPSCPVFAEFQPGGATGRGSGGGGGGDGGQDSRGPISGPGCPDAAICCGLADFTVPTMFRGPQPGRAGRPGGNGTAGGGCADAFGRFVDGDWVPSNARNGTAGSAGSGGGGGGGGGSAVLDWMDGVCEFVDGLGGGGGGGGSGGCGGTFGRAGSSGGPSVAVLIRYEAARPAQLPRIADSVLSPSDGARGGDGGAGGAGGRGAPGAFGGELDRDARSTPTLAGPFPGGRGGPGAAGGDGGGGGGGCGGASVGVWVVGHDGDTGRVSEWRASNLFQLGRPGLPGRGGGGASPGGDGAEGGASDVRLD